MKQSVFDLAYQYFDIFYPPEKLITTEKKASVLESFYSLLKGKWTSEELMGHLKEVAKNTPGVEPYQGNLLVFFSTKAKLRLNLLDPHSMYFHPELRIVPPLPTIEVDIDTGVIDNKPQDYYMEYRASYSIEDMINYWNWTVKPISKYQNARWVGGFKHLLNMYFVDLVLYMIDTVACVMKENGISAPTSPIEIEEYLQRASEILVERTTELITYGGLQLVYKRRVPLDRRRSSPTLLSP
jgi:hypothetical protein